MNQPKNNEKGKTIIPSILDFRVHPLRARITSNEDRQSIGTVISREQVENVVSI